MLLTTRRHLKKYCTSAVFDAWPHSGGGRSGSASNNSNEPQMLYSGGIESCLVTWQLAGGSSRPSDIIPHVAMGGILHIVTSCMSSGGRVLVYTAMDLRLTTINNPGFIQ